MDQIVGIASLIASLMLIWQGKRLEFRSLGGTIFSCVELLGIGLAVVAAGWWGLAALAGVNVVGFLVWSVILASRVESKLVYAAIQADESKQTMRALAKRLRHSSELKATGPVEQAELISLLADRNRSIEEIEAMAPPIVMLHKMHGVALPWMVERFDRLLRLTGEPASKSREVAATIHASATNAAATFTEMVDAFITVYSGEAPPTEEPALSAAAET